MWVHTSDVRGAGTDANVYLVVYGNKGKSDEVWLDNKSNNFEAGQTDNFKIEISDVGKPFKIRVGHDNSRPASAWHLNKVEIIMSMSFINSIPHCNLINIHVKQHACSSYHV